MAPPCAAHSSTQNSSRQSRGWVGRQRLVELMNRGVESTLTLVSAPAGFGKSSLLADWREASTAQEGLTA